MRGAIATAVLFYCLSLGGSADVPPGDVEISPSVAAVVTGGQWETGSSHGHFRAIIANQGFEHVSSVLWLEWIEENAEARELKVVSRVRVAEVSNGFWSLGFDGREQFLDKRLKVSGTNPYSLEEDVIVVEMGLPGSYQLLEQAE